jgi:hypothetical protein
MTIMFGLVAATHGAAATPKIAAATKRSHFVEW